MWAVPTHLAGPDGDLSLRAEACMGKAAAEAHFASCPPEERVNVSLANSGPSRTVPRRP
jgi:hypothetical protein